MNGFYPDIEIKIADNSQIGNIILLVKERLKDNYTLEKHKEEAHKELLERGYDETLIAEWLEFIEE